MVHGGNFLPDEAAKIFLTLKSKRNQVSSWLMQVKVISRVGVWIPMFIQDHYRKQISPIEHNLKINFLLDY